MQFWKVTRSALGIVITCRGHDKDGTVGAAVQAFHELAGDREDAFAIIADLREMTGYESESRVAWQQAFYKHRKRIEGLVLVGARSALIRMGAAAVGAFAGIPVRFVATWDEVSRALRAGGVLRYSTSKLLNSSSSNAHTAATRGTSRSAR